MLSHTQSPRNSNVAIFYGIPRPIILFTDICHWSSPLVTLIHSRPQVILKTHINNILHLRYIISHDFFDEFRWDIVDAHNYNYEILFTQRVYWHVLYQVIVVTDMIYILYMYIYYIYNRSWVDTRWQQYITHLHTNSTHNIEKGKLGNAGRTQSLRVIPWHLPYNWGKSTEKPPIANYIECLNL
jgi:hypothetical protein